MSKGPRGLAALGKDAYLATGNDAETGADVATAARVGARIAEARTKARLTGGQLGSAMGGLGKDQVSKIEKGKRRVDVGELAGAASALGVSVRYLLGQPERSSLAMAARLATGEGSETTRVARQRARQLLEFGDLLSRVTGMPAAQPSPDGAQVLDAVRTAFAGASRTTKATARKQGREVAELTRRELDLGSDALGDLATLIEQHFGVDVSLSPSGTAGDGLCVHGDEAALILASSDFPDGHLRFTLAHELGHHLLNDPREVIEEAEHEMFADDFVEWRVNAFAGHLLMPERGIRSMLSWLAISAAGIDERALTALMEHFGVSRQALVYQLNLLGLMTYNEGQRLQEAVTVSAMVAAHRDVAPNGAATRVSQVHRAPQRLVRAARDAVRSQQLGLSVVAALLAREDDDVLWAEVMGATGSADLTSLEPELATGPTPTVTDDDIDL